MLKHRPHEHLSTEQLMQALVDLSDLETERQSHLAQCTTCQRDLERLKHGFGSLGRRAAQMAPAPARPFRLPQKAAPEAWWRFKPMWATVAAGALLFALTVWWPHPLAPPGPVPTVAVQNPAAAVAFIDQVDALVDDALPTSWQALADTSELSVMDDDMDWLVPPMDGSQDDDSWI